MIALCFSSFLIYCTTLVSQNYLVCLAEEQQIVYISRFYSIAALCITFTEMCLLSFETSSLLVYCFRFYFLLMMDIAKSETFKNFIILNKALLFLIKLPENNIKNLAIFCYAYFEEVLVSLNFAKNFDFLAGVSSKIFAIKTLLRSKDSFLCNAFGKIIYLICYVSITIAHEYLILELVYMYYANLVFLSRNSFYKFFPKVNSLKTYCASFFG